MDVTRRASKADIRDPLCYLLMNTTLLCSLHVFRYQGGIIYVTTGFTRLGYAKTGRADC